MGTKCQVIEMNRFRGFNERFFQFENRFRCLWHGSHCTFGPPDLKEFSMSRLFNKCREASEWNSPPLPRRGIPFGCFATFQVHCVFTNLTVLPAEVSSSSEEGSSALTQNLPQKTR